ncbi:MAG: mucoidy inhibitor MuiA family protein, partial [Candidatus Eisenbacteria bacterium]|nr:mucoidy inhibitor MuiA family protein [Candidatus Eisenbacteria bacterium]
MRSPGRVRDGRGLFLYTAGGATDDCPYGRCRNPGRLAMSRKPTVPARQMLVPLSVLLCLAAVPASAPAQTETPIATEIVSATVYSRQAQIVREGEVTLEAGSYRLLCRDLPGGAVESSLDVVGSGLEGARIVGIDFRRASGDTTLPPRAAEYRSELGRIKDELKELELRRKTLSERENLTESIGGFSSGLAEERLADRSFGVTEWTAFLDFYERELMNVKSELRGVLEETQELVERRNHLRAELEAMQVASRQRVLAVECEVDEPGTMRVELSYIVPGAEWTPEYAVRYMEQDDVVELSYGARLVQSTGEDWDGVSVVLSTAKPHVGAAPPALAPHFVGMTT